MKGSELNDNWPRNMTCAKIKQSALICLFYHKIVHTKNIMEIDYADNVFFVVVENW